MARPRSKQQMSNATTFLENHHPGAILKLIRGPEQPDAGRYTPLLQAREVEPGRGSSGSRSGPVARPYDPPETTGRRRLLDSTVRGPARFLTCHRHRVKALLIVVVLHASPIYAAALSYSYLEGSYTQLETDGDEVGGVTAGGMMREATIQGSVRLTDQLFFYGGLSEGDLNDVDGLDELAIALGTHEIDASATTSSRSIGAGIQLQPAEDLSVYARAGYVRRKLVVSFTMADVRSLADDSADGPQAALGARALLGRMELFAEAAYTYLSDHQQGDGTALELGFELDFSPRLAARVAYLATGGDHGFNISARWYYSR